MSPLRLMARVPVLIIALCPTIGGCTQKTESSHGTKVDDAGVRTDAGVPAQVAELFVIEVDGGLNEARQCERNSDCTVVQTHCTCFLVDIEDVAAINRRFVDRVSLTCNQRCSTPSAPQFIPKCEAGLCEVFDVREHPVSECVAAADCALRVRECCECGGNTEVDAVIALPPVNFDDYQVLVCDDAKPVCDSCVATYPPAEGFGLIAHISCLSGHCSADAVRVEPQ